MAQKSLRRYETDAYSFCDCLDWIATRKGAYLADRAVSVALSDLFSDYPEVVKQFEPHIVARHKALAKMAESFKQAQDEFTQAGALFEQALRDAAQRPGGDKTQVLEWARQIIAQASSEQGPGGATTTKAARGDTFWDGVSNHILQTGGMQKP